ncbi:MAG TPA: SDR family NAD(P)-dependent oxidoreductase [Piscinibacter sp.]|mgnify:CR=1 FL=1|jgi:NAD(P)-dependent dehydrogenase (short-subunit alcohol dehydrogenase family)|nr:SDR family NAD(P)-dependent oxidoreductase [Burkholderiaceae bacterium]HPG80140.1 SDR family NAD(P)-dependent oxidoreductase [Piscinibacter sp.]
MSDQATKKVCLVIGVGDGVGAAIAKAFALDGFETVITRRARNLPDLEAIAQKIRDQGGVVHARGVDARSEEETVALFQEIERDIGPIEVMVFNIGANVRFAIEATTARVFTKVWEMACFAGFLAGREAAKVMVPRGRGTILFTGATASMRGRENFSAFASAKAGLRAVAQSMARELGKKNIHVAHIVCDGSIDGVFSRENIPDLDQRLAEDRVLKPDDIALNYLSLHHQKRSAWTHEMDLRPWSENW